MKFFLISCTCLLISVASYGKPGDCQLTIDYAISEAQRVTQIETYAKAYKELGKESSLSPHIQEYLERARIAARDAVGITKIYCND